MTVTGAANFCNNKSLITIVDELKQDVEDSNSNIYNNFYKKTDQVMIDLIDDVNNIDLSTINTDIENLQIDVENIINSIKKLGNNTIIYDKDNSENFVKNNLNYYLTGAGRSNNLEINKCNLIDNIQFGSSSSNITIMGGLSVAAKITTTDCLITNDLTCDSNVNLGSKDTGNVVIKNGLKLRGNLNMEEIIEGSETEDSSATHNIILKGGNIIVGRKKEGSTRKILPFNESEKTKALIQSKLKELKDNNNPLEIYIKAEHRYSYDETKTSNSEKFKLITDGKPIIYKLTDLNKIIHNINSQEFDIVGKSINTNDNNTYVTATEDTWFYIKNIGWFKNQSSVIKGGSVYAYDIKDIKGSKDILSQKLEKEENSYNNVMLHDEIDENTIAKPNIYRTCIDTSSLKIRGNTNLIGKVNIYDNINIYKDANIKGV